MRRFQYKYDDNKNFDVPNVVRVSNKVEQCLDTGDWFVLHVSVVVRIEKRMEAGTAVEPIPWVSTISERAERDEENSPSGQQDPN
jgi:hypothetical protein